MKASPIRLVATDLDGTLLRSDGTVSERTVALLGALEESGTVVVFVTARPVRWVRELRAIVHGHGVVICANGAVVYDAHADRVMESRTLPGSIARAIVASVRARAPGARFAREALSGFGKEPDYPERHPTPAGSLVGPIEPLLADDTVKLLIRAEASAAEELESAVAEIVGDRAEATTSDGSGVVEVSGRGVTKAATLARFCAARGITAADVLAVGDMRNDLPMLGWAGTAAAVANAHPDVLAAVDRVAPSNDEDGVAMLLGELLEAGPRR